MAPARSCGSTMSTTPVNENELFTKVEGIVRDEVIFAA
jgi:hypothetical protein